MPKIGKGPEHFDLHVAGGYHQEDCEDPDQQAAHRDAIGRHHYAHAIERHDFEYAQEIRREYDIR
jgi:hypothetical protein